MPFTPAPELASIVRAGVIWLAGATVVERDSRMNAPIAATEAAIRGLAAESGAGDVASGLSRTIAAVRSMYKRVGIDPTKTRPSSEATRAGHSATRRPIRRARW